MIKRALIGSIESSQRGGEIKMYAIKCKAFNLICQISEFFCFLYRKMKHMPFHSAIIDKFVSFESLNEFIKQSVL